MSSFHVRPDVDERVSAAIDLLERKTFVALEPRILRATWMGLLETRTSVQHTSIMAQRSTVDSSISIEPAVLDIKWPAFVYLALASGVDAYNWDLYQMVRTLASEASTRNLRLKDCRGHSKFYASKVNGKLLVSFVPGIHSLYWRRALAWELLMLLEDGKKLICVSVMNSNIFLPSDIADFTPAGLSIARSSSNRQPMDDECLDAADPSNPLGRIFSMKKRERWTSLVVQYISDRCIKIRLIGLTLVLGLNFYSPNYRILRLRWSFPSRVGC